MDSGVTEGKTSQSNAWKQELAVAMEIEVWFPLGTLLNAGKTDTWDDLGATAVPPHQGVQPVTYFYGYGLLPASGTKHPDERVTVLKAFTHTPAMPWSHFIVETIGSAPAPLNLSDADSALDAGHHPGVRRRGAEGRPGQPGGKGAGPRSD